MGKTVQVYGFPSYVSAGSVQEFLETKTGTGTIYALKLRETKNGGSRKYAIVQFTSSSSAEHMISLASSTLWYGRSYLKVRPMENDIIPKPRIFLHSMTDITMHFGCQISKKRFSSFWRAANVSIDFGIQLRKIYFHFSHSGTEYKLELPYENLWQIQLHRPYGQLAKYLVIQLYGIPYIYEKDAPNLGNIFDDPSFNFFMYPPDDHWLRTTDFTASSSIGQSSCLCLELPLARNLPNFRENFAFYEEDDSHFLLETGSTFSSNQDIVPIIGSPQGVDLPFDVLFKVSCLVQNGCLSGPTLDKNFFQLVDPCRTSNIFVEIALDRLFHLKECCYEPVKWLSEQYNKHLSLGRPPKSSPISVDPGLVYVRRVQVTPTKVYFSGPEINVSNRVLRHYIGDIDNFLRVNFIDENWDRIHSTDLSPRSSSRIANRRTKIYSRIISILRNGITIGSKRFEFLAFSSSQLRENSLWMFASRPGLNANDIREWMGNFRQIRNVAKYAARLGQSFGSSTETLEVHPHEVLIIPDVEVKWAGTKYNFSDGIGKISAGFAKRVAKKCGIDDFTPSAFQIRYGGYKGVVAFDPTMVDPSKKLALRMSMYKYESDNQKLDVLGWSKYQPCYLNRQLISLLSTLGVPDDVFERKQREVINQLNTILQDPVCAGEALELMSPGENTNILKEMLMVGYKPDAEPFLSMMLQTFRASKLTELRLKSRIFVQNGRAMMGCLDETRTLEYGEVFVKFSGTGSNKNHYLVRGKVVVAKNPCLHPGDVRILTAVDVPALHHMVNCVVFPQKGKRPHTNECSGSDLDGDIYFVCWDPEMVPPQEISPMDYTPAPSTSLDHDVTIEEVGEYFANYIVNDSLGIIANAHTAFADREPSRAMSNPCIELAKLFSIAVDFPKTGVPAVIPAELYVKEYPDFMEKLDKSTYESKSVIGKLFRVVKDISMESGSTRSFTKEVSRRSFDYDMEVDGYEDYIEDAVYYKGNYDRKLGDLMDYYGIKSEAEILSGSIMKMSKSFNKRRDTEAITVSVRALRKEARSWFNEKSTSNPGSDDVYAKASAWYYVTYHPSYWGCYNEGMKRDHYLSFAWCVYDKLISIKRDKQVLRRTLNISSSDLERQLRNGLYIS